MRERKIPFVPPEFMDYYQWMDKKMKYDSDTIRKHIDHVKRVGVVLLNSNAVEPSKIAELITSKRLAAKGIVYTINNYRDFKWRTEHLENQIGRLMSMRVEV